MHSIFRNQYTSFSLRVVTPCVFMSFLDAFLSFGVLPAFIDSLSLANMSIDIQLFSAPVSNKALISLSCILTGKVVPIFLPNTILKTCSISQQTHSTKYTSGPYLHSSHVSVFSSSEASTSSAGFWFHPLVTVYLVSD